VTQTLKSREDAFNLAKRQFETGYLAPGADAGGFRTALNAGADPPLQHQIAQQENALSLLLGANPARLSATRIRAADAAALPSQLPSTLNRRPDIVQAQRQLVADATLASSQARAVAAVHQPDRHRQPAGSHPARPAG
jgi:hypothetical protein